MVYIVTQSFVFNDRVYHEGDLIKLTDKEFLEYKDKVAKVKKYTKVIK